MPDDARNQWIQDLVSIAPEWFENDPRTPISLFSIECDRGWAHLIRAILETGKWRKRQWDDSYKYWSEQSEEDKRKYPTSYERRKQEFDKTQHQNPFNNIHIVQVKEKFGGLRFYFSGGDESFHDFVHAVEHISHYVCEQCGAPGRCRESLPWVLSLCDTHLTNHLAEMGWTKEDFVESEARLDEERKDDL